MSTDTGALVLYEDVEAAASTVGLSCETASEIWSDLKELGFEGATAKHKEGGARLKKDWEKVTEETYWYKAAKDWKPEYFTTTDLPDLKERCHKLKEQYAKAVQKESCSGEFLENQKVIAATLPELLEDVQALQAEVARADKLVKEAEAELEKLEIPTKLAYSCPDCQCQILIQGDKAVKADRKAGSPEELQLAMHEVTKQQKLIGQLKNAWRGMKETYERTTNEANFARAAESRVKSAEALGEYPPSETIANELHKANLELDAVERWITATSIQWQIEEKILILKVLKVLEPTSGEEPVNEREDNHTKNHMGRLSVS